MINLKKWASALLCAICLIISLPSQSLAAAGDEHGSGVTTINMNSGYSISWQTATDAATDAASSYSGDFDGTTKTVYESVEKITLTFTGNDEEYMVFLLKGDTDLSTEDSIVPTEDSLYYIDQTTGGETTSFTIYPNTLEEAGTYYIYVSSATDGYTKVGSFEVVSTWTEAAYTLGDVDGDGDVDAYDVTVLLRHVSKIEFITNESLLASADVQSDDDINANDVTKLLRYVSKIITTLD